MARTVKKKDEAYYIDKLLRMGDEFQKAALEKNWFLAKYLYDCACKLTVFLEAPQDIREQLFGKYNEDTDSKDDGLFDDKTRNKVMKETIIKDHLGNECVVYRIPGEVGFYGAQRKKGTRFLSAEENPAFWEQ